MLMFSQPSQSINNDLTLYLWAAGISGNATLGSHDVPSLPVDVDFDDIFEDLEFGFQVYYEGVGEKRRGGMDYTYIKLGNTNDEGVCGEANSTLAAFGIYRANAHSTS